MCAHILYVCVPVKVSHEQQPDQSIAAHSIFRRTMTQVATVHTAAPLSELLSWLRRKITDSGAYPRLRFIWRSSMHKWLLPTGSTGSVLQWPSSLLPVRSVFSWVSL